jgi:hypothetical protein
MSRSVLLDLTQSRLAQRHVKLILDINDRIGAAADDRARGAIIRKLRGALEAEP